MTDEDVDTFDVIVIGAGAAGMSAACTAAAMGRRVLLVEHSDRVGGTTAISGGMVWIPANHKMRSAGIDDSLDRARAYLNATVPGSAGDSRMEAFLTQADEAIRFLEAHTQLRLQAVPRYPDYEPTQAGATEGGRVLEPVPYDGRQLGPDFRLLRDPLPDFMLFGSMMVSRQDLPVLRQALRSAPAFRHAAQLIVRHVWQRLHAHRGTSLYLGNALAARLFKSLRELRVELRISVRVNGLWVERSRVAGLEIADGQQIRRLRARLGVILATGGLSHHASLRQAYVPEVAGNLSATVHAGATTSGVQLAREVGAQLSPTDRTLAFWVPASIDQRPDGSRAVFPHTVTDRAKPGLIAVNGEGRRFVNEARSYHHFVTAQLRDPGRCCPAWLICDRRFLWSFGLGRLRPFSLPHTVQQACGRGYLTRASSVAALADRIGVPVDTLVRTVSRYNASAAFGLDPEFDRGGDPYQRHLGDSSHHPNPCVAPLLEPPFYAVAVHPADLGMAAGVMTDPDGQVIDATGTPIDGLYACGNDMHSVMNGSYPGPGITLGPALVFGYLAARKICDGPDATSDRS
jgi:succinate dehydrogenase/fumarate reductase flavoprotein subunit